MTDIEAAASTLSDDGEIREEGEIEDDEDDNGNNAAAGSGASDDEKKEQRIADAKKDSERGNGILSKSRFSARLKPSRHLDHEFKKDHDFRRSPRHSDDSFGFVETARRSAAHSSDGDRDDDKDYRRHENDEFGDSDFREPRRRRRSPSPGEWGSRPLKRSRGGFASRGGRFSNRDTRHIICKFYREGYCRDGDKCVFSHAALDSLRQPELCKFYKQGYCKKGLHCLHLHGEFPCIGYHRGECDRNDCGFSHLPLTDYTKPIFRKYNAIFYGDDFTPLENPAAAIAARQNGSPSQREAENGGGQYGAARAQLGRAAGSPPTSTLGYGSGSAHVPSRRPPLLPGGPPGFEKERDAAAIAQSHDRYAPPSTIPPPQLVHPFTPEPVATPYGALYQRPSPQHDDSAYAPSTSSSAGAATAAAPTFDINNMLAQFTANAATNNGVDSPASPPGMNPFHRPTAVPWRVFRVFCPPTYASVDEAVMTKCGPSDPRIARVRKAHVDAVSSIFTADRHRPPTMSMPTGDPRLRARQQHPQQPSSMHADPRSAPPSHHPYSWMANGL